MVAMSALSGYLISLATAVLLISLSSVESKRRVPSKSSRSHRPADKIENPHTFIEQLSGSDAFEQALQFFDEKNYQDAAEFFWAAVLKGGESFTVRFDLI